jgi:hypothetical protein
MMNLPIHYERNDMRPRQYQMVAGSLLVCALLVLSFGCEDQASPNAKTPSEDQSPSTEMEGRLEAALAMAEGVLRHNTLVNVAKDAADKGEGEVVLRAVAAMGNGVARDNLCAACSLRLAKQGMSSMATSIAKEMADENARNNVLARIANQGSK